MCLSVGRGRIRLDILDVIRGHHRARTRAHCHLRCVECQAGQLRASLVPVGHGTLLRGSCSCSCSSTLLSQGILSRWLPLLVYLGRNRGGRNRSWRILDRGLRGQRRRDDGGVVDALREGLLTNRLIIGICALLRRNDILLDRQGRDRVAVRVPSPSPTAIGGNEVGRRKVERLRRRVDSRSGWRRGRGKRRDGVR
jgi:hypothetical protein